MRKSVFVFAFILPALMNAQNPSGYKIGDAVADFRLKNVDGKMVSLSDQKEAKGAIVIFTCNHCPYAKAYEQRIIDLDKQFRPQGFPVIAINPNDPKRVPDDSFEHMVKRAKEKKYPFPYLVDETQQVARTFGATRTPQVFLLNRSGDKWVVSYIGAIDDNTEDAGAVKNAYVINAINALLKGEEPPVRETKAIGCTIKWKV
ncbi:MAG: thioredoxin family protein [Chitinophagales bacterium]|nr:thioredoxin family protein [Chitinophagales bacterium]MDW8393659.1 thioredoxin family protein [Chitinophagales bacterium]